MNCSRCNSVVQNGDTFCSQCGNFVGTESSLIIKSIPLTVLRADLADFTKISEILDPEEVMSLLRLCFDRLSQIIIDKKGVILRFIGDEVIGIFGLSSSDAHTPLMALFAAQEMHNAIREISLTKIVKESLGIKIGIETDTTFIYCPKPDAQVNACFFLGSIFYKALHLQKMCRVNSILVGENTYQRAKNFFEFREAKLGIYLGQSFLSYELLPL
ncbi:MAG: adenylate/guanylate cyclase domain-containing protein [candidate division WOR-3 bacterium]